MKLIKLHLAALVSLIALIFFTFTSARASSISLIAEIQIPNWAVTANPAFPAVPPVPPLLTNASFDLLSFDPNTKYMFSADRPNRGVDVIDTKTNTLLGIIPVPPQSGGTSNPSGVQVAPDLKKLIVTDRGTGAAGGGVYVYDISNLPANLSTVVPQATFQYANAKATDELSYDPTNHRVYVNNTTADATGQFYMTVIDVNTNTKIGQIPIVAPGGSSPEQPRFDPADGFVYTTTGGNSTVLRIDPNFVLDPNNPLNNAGAIVQKFDVPGCSPAGLDMNPADNVALLGCNPGGPNGAPQVLMNLTNGNIVRTIPGITATDVLAFDPSLGEWFTASQNLNISNGCLQAQSTIGVPGTTPTFPQVGGIFDNSNFALQTGCTGQGAHGLGVDPLNNTIYVPVGVFPSDGSAGLNSFAGILVFQATKVPEPSSLLLLGSGLLGIAAWYRRRKN